MISLSQAIQYRIWPPRPSLEYLLNYKTFSGFPSLDTTATDLMGPVSQQLVPDSFFWLGDMKINFHIFQGLLFQNHQFMGDETKPFLKGNIYKYRAKKTAIVFDKMDISNEEDFCHQLYIFFTVIWTQTAGFVPALNPLSSLFGISCGFQFHNLWRAWNGQHWPFHNLALFSI